MTTSIRSNIKGIIFLFIFYTSYYVHYIVIRLLMLSFLFYSIIDISKLWRVNMKFFYEGINKFMYKHPFIKSCVYFASKFCPWMVAIFYSLFLLKIVIESQTGFYLLFIKPFVVLLITVLLRILIDRPRPIQKYDLKPIDDKKRIGHSFPSIHTSLAISIALTVIARGPNMGLLLSALAITITCTRLLTGVHYLTDILASILIALAIYMI